jgi:S1-C subfamily serine protease
MALLLAVGLLFDASGQSQDRRKRRLSPHQIALASFPSVVVLTTEDSDAQPVTLGSGFFVAGNLVATNYHVVKGAARIYVKRIDEQNQQSTAVVVANDEDNDISILRVTGMRGRPLMLARHQQTGIGDEIFAIGNPEGLAGTFSQGIVSALRGREYIQITAPISHGSSGGPVLNSYAEVIGVALGTIENGQNLNFAVPVAYVSRLIDGMPARVTSQIASASRTHNSAKSYFEDGDHLTEEGKLRAALEAYKRAVAINRRYPGALYALASTYQALGMNTQAIQSYKEAIRLKSGDSATTRLAYFDLASLYEELGRVQEAVDLYKQEISEMPNDVTPYLLLSTLYEQQGQYAEAVELIKPAYVFDPDRAFSHLGSVYFSLRESDIEAYKRLVIQSPSNSSYRMVLGMLYLTTGDGQSAKKELGVLQTLDPPMARLLVYVLANCESGHPALCRKGN